MTFKNPDVLKTLLGGPLIYDAIVSRLSDTIALDRARLRADSYRRASQKHQGIKNPRPVSDEAVVENGRRIIVTAALSIYAGRGFVIDDGGPKGSKIFQLTPAGREWVERRYPV